MISRPYFSESITLKHNFVMNESCVEKYALDNYFKDVYVTSCQGKKVHELYYHLHDNLLYHLGKLCIPQGEIANVIREAHNSLIVGHLGVGKTLEKL